MQGFFVFATDTFTGSVHRFTRIGLLILPEAEFGLPQRHRSSENLVLLYGTASPATRKALSRD